MARDANLILAHTAECVTPRELQECLETTASPSAYIGFEPSGLAHIGLLVTAGKVTDLLGQGFKVTVLLADWHARINDKLGGDMETIRLGGRYLAQCFEALVPDRLHGVLRFKTATQLVGDADYWERVVRVAKACSVARVRRALTIMGRSEVEAEADASMYLYPAMQVADIFELGVDVALGGMDQRKAHMLARDVAEKLGWTKPIALHTPLLGSLSGGGRMEMEGEGKGDGRGDGGGKKAVTGSGVGSGVAMESKMSKSDPDAALLLHDGQKAIAKKLRKAFCPLERPGNPVLDLWEYVLTPGAARAGEKLMIERPDKFGGDLSFDSYRELEEAYLAGRLHPLDLKNGGAATLSRLLGPVRESFDVKPEVLDELRQALAGV